MMNVSSVVLTAAAIKVSVGYTSDVDKDGMFIGMFYQMTRNARTTNKFKYYTITSSERSFLNKVVMKIVRMPTLHPVVHL